MFCHPIKLAKITKNAIFAFFQRWFDTFANDCILCNPMLAGITFANNSNNSDAGGEYGISEKLVRDWRKISTRLLEKPKKSVLTEAKRLKHPKNGKGTC